MKKSVIVWALCAMASVAMATERKVIVHLVDGSTLIGIPTFDTVKIKFSFVEADVPLSLIAGFSVGTNTVREAFTNQDLLTGVPRFAELGIQTSFGNVSLRVPQIRSVSFSAEAGDWLGLRTPDFSSLDALKGDPRLACLAQLHDYSGFFEESPRIAVPQGWEYQFPCRGAQGYKSGNSFSVWAKLNRVTGRGVAIWKYANGGGFNAVAVAFSKVEGGWRGKGLSILGHPVELFFRDDGLSLTMEWGAAFEGAGNSYIQVIWHPSTGEARGQGRC